MVSGRAGIGLIDSLFEHDLTPASTISNIVIICNSKNKKSKLELEFKKKNYSVSMDIILYDRESKFLAPIKDKITECLNSTHAQKMREQVKEFGNDLPSSYAKNEESK